MAMAPPPAAGPGIVHLRRHERTNRCVKTEKARKLGGRETCRCTYVAGGAYGRESVDDGRRLRFRWIPPRHVKRREHLPLAAPINFSGNGALIGWAAGTRQGEELPSGTMATRGKPTGKTGWRQRGSNGTVPFPHATARRLRVRAVFAGRETGGRIR